MTFLQLFYNYHQIRSDHIKYIFIKTNIPLDLQKEILKFLICSHCNILYDDNGLCWCFYFDNVYLDEIVSNEE